ncbi:hypothetical protein BOTNAR_0146g00020 [Botryotinia narcissicola]|uniref:Uncharacterized protein n=1 Tax=Botryotinia narcissicola TaxID=278944 RepID=A0A4Z1IFJ2_9HELO|nr:hypothetical protein BOTNAR_0146g00020 [Botryotinia narcissicola]
MIKALMHMISMAFLREPIKSMSIREFVMNFDKDYPVLIVESASIDIVMMVLVVEAILVLALVNYV